MKLLAAHDLPADAFPLHLWVTDPGMTERYIYRYLDGIGEIELPRLNRPVVVTVLYEGQRVMTVNGDGIPGGGKRFDVLDVPELIARINAVRQVLLPEAL